MRASPSLFTCLFTLDAFGHFRVVRNSPAFCRPSPTSENSWCSAFWGFPTERLRACWRKPSRRPVRTRTVSLYGPPPSMAKCCAGAAVGLSGVSYDFSDENQDDPELIQRVEEFAVKAKTIIPTIIAHAIGARPVLIAAWGAGFTHISGTLITDKFPETRSAVRFPATKIYMPA